MKILISTTIHMPIYAQIVNQLRDAVIKGELTAGEGIPSIRALARDLQVSVITTKRAYEELEKEGVIEPIAGLGPVFRADLRFRIKKRGFCIIWVGNTKNLAI